MRPSDSSRSPSTMSRAYRSSSRSSTSGCRRTSRGILTGSTASSITVSFERHEKLAPDSRRLPPPHRPLSARLLTAVPSVIGVIIVTFLLTRALPGDPAAYFAGPAATHRRSRKSANTRLRPQPAGAVRRISQRSGAGRSRQFAVDRPAGAEELLTRLPPSAELTLLGLLLSVAIAVPLGITAAKRPESWVDHLCRIVSTAGVSLPMFFTGLLLVYVFYYLLAGRRRRSAGSILSIRRRRSAPAFIVDSLLAGDVATTLAALAPDAPRADPGDISLAPLARVTRASMLSALGSRLRPCRAGERAGAAADRLCLCLPQCGAAGDHHARHGVLVSARRQRAGRKGVRLAGHRLLRDRGADRFGLRAGAGLRPHHGAASTSCSTCRSTCLRRGRPARGCPA